MRWLLLVLVACAHHYDAPIASHREAVDAPHVAREPADLVAIPTLPPKRLVESSTEAVCRASYTRLAAKRWRYREDTIVELRELVARAIEAGGDCRIDVDALVASRVARGIGGCGGPTLAEAMESWDLLAAVATTPYRRRAALRNAASLAHWQAKRSLSGSLWRYAGDRYLRAAAAEPDDEQLSIYAVDAYEQAVVSPSFVRSELVRVAHALERITDGSAADRARVLRAKLHF
jgi:hypothetical protein